MTKDQTIAIIKTLQESFVFLGKALMETKVPNADIKDDIESLEDAITEIISDIPDDTEPTDDTEPQADEET